MTRCLWLSEMEEAEMSTITSKLGSISDDAIDVENDLHRMQVRLISILQKYDPSFKPPHRDVVRDRPDSQAHTDSLVIVSSPFTDDNTTTLVDADDSSDDAVEDDGPRKPGPSAVPSLVTSPKKYDSIEQNRERLQYPRDEHTPPKWVSQISQKMSEKYTRTPSPKEDKPEPRLLRRPSVDVAIAEETDSSASYGTANSPGSADTSMTELMAASARPDKNHGPGLRDIILELESTPTATPIRGASHGPTTSTPLSDPLYKNPSTPPRTRCQSQEPTASTPVSYDHLYDTWAAPSGSHSRIEKCIVCNTNFSLDQSLRSIQYHTNKCLDKQDKSR